MKKGICSILLILTVFNPVRVFAIELPETIEEAGETAKNVGWELSDKLPDQSKRIWKEEALPIIKNTFNIIKKEVWPILKNFFNNMFPNAETEIEKRKPFIEEELEKEKEEIREELPVVTKNVWEKLKQILK
jgi:hypothetical protein